MPFSTLLKLLLAIWVVAEFLVFVGVARLIGTGWAVLAGVATTLLGASLLKRTGKAAVMRLRAALQGRHDGRIDDVLDGGLAAFAAALLVLPGFLSDLVGAALAIPAYRARAARWVRSGGLGLHFERSGAARGPQTIDLDREEWRTRSSGGGELLR